MSEEDNLNEQERMWGLLYDQISAVLRTFGIEDHFGRADYLLVSDNYGWKRHTIEIHKLQMLDSALIKLLQPLLDKFPGWQIVIAVDIPGTEGKWPPMGLRIQRDTIIDELQRQYLPAEFQGVQY